MTVSDHTRSARVHLLPIRCTPKNNNTFVIVNLVVSDATFPSPFFRTTTWSGLWTGSSPTRRWRRATPCRTRPTRSPTTTTSSPTPTPTAAPRRLQTRTRQGPGSKTGLDVSESLNATTDISAATQAFEGIQRDFVVMGRLLLSREELDT